MDDAMTFVVAVLYAEGNSVLRCAVKVNTDNAPPDLREYYCEPECREFLHSLLPLHVQSCGPVIAVEKIFDLVDTTKGGE